MRNNKQLREQLIGKHLVCERKKIVFPFEVIITDVDPSDLSNVKIKTEHVSGDYVSGGMWDDTWLTVWDFNTMLDNLEHEDECVVKGEPLKDHQTVYDQFLRHD